MPLSPAVHDGIRKFIRLSPLRSNPQYTKRIRDEFDLMEALDVACQNFHETASMLGKKMYKGLEFDPVEDVKRGMEEWLLTGREIKDTALARGKNLIMYHLVVEPVIDMFKGMSHKTVLQTVDKNICEVQEIIRTMPLISHYDDAIVALTQVQAMVKQREERRKAEHAAKRKKRRKRKEIDIEAIRKAEEATDI